WHGSLSLLSGFEFPVGPRVAPRRKDLCVWISREGSRFQRLAPTRPPKRCKKIRMSPDLLERDCLHIPNDHIRIRAGRDFAVWSNANRLYAAGTADRFAVHDVCFRTIDEREYYIR